MSYDLTIKSDDEWSRFAQVKPLTDFIAALPHVNRNGDVGFVFNDAQRYMEIDLEVVNEGGDSVEECEPGNSEVNCVSLHIPYASLGEAPEREYFPIAFAIAKHLQWQVFDEQEGEYLDPENYSG